MITLRPCESLHHVLRVGAELLLIEMCAINRGR